MNKSSVLNDNLGVSSMIAFSKKGKSIIDKLSIQTENIDYNRLVQYNSCLISSVLEPNNREAFWADFNKNGFRGVKKYYKRADTIKSIVIKRLLRIKHYLERL